MVGSWGPLPLRIVEAVEGVPAPKATRARAWRRASACVDAEEVEVDGMTSIVAGNGRP